MKNYFLLLLTLFSMSCTNQKKESQQFSFKNKVDDYLTSIMTSHNIPGLALAVIEGNTIIYENYFGVASLEDSSLVKSETLFRVFSATKLITTTGIFQLIEDGKLTLEDPLVQYFDDLPEEWQQVKIKHLLSHSSGIPNFIRYESKLSDQELKDKLYADAMEFETGYQHSYNQTNYWLLSQIIQKVTQTSFDNYILTNQFDGSTNGVLFSSNALETIPNRATRYHFSYRENQFIKDTRNDGISRGHPGNGLNITLKKFIEWDQNLKNNTLLSEETKTSMWSPFTFTNNFKYQKDKFLHGWGYYAVNELDSYGFSGGNLAAYRYFPASNTTIIMLSNGYKTEAFDIIINDVARLVLPDLKQKEPILEKEIMDLAQKGDFDQTLTSYVKLKKENPTSRFDNLKSNINGIGNSYFWDDELEKSFQVFQLNASIHPTWWIAISGLAEVYEAQQDSLLAVEHYKKAISLNEKNEWNYNEIMRSKVDELSR